MVKEREIEKERVQLYQRCRTEPNLIEGGVRGAWEGGKCEIKWFSPTQNSQRRTDGRTVGPNFLRITHCLQENDIFNLIIK